jgi:hypothetical protein
MLALFIALILNLAVAQSHHNPPGSTPDHTICETSPSATWAGASGRWIIPNESSSPVQLSYSGRNMIRTAVPDRNGVNQPLIAEVQQTNLTRVNQSFLPSGSVCHGVFSPEQIDAAMRAKKPKICIRATQLFRANTLQVEDHVGVTYDPSDLRMTSVTYDMCFGIHPGKQESTWRVTDTRLSY